MIRKTISLFAVCGLTLMIGCGGTSTNESGETPTSTITQPAKNESGETPTSTTTQPAKDEATWVINTPGDAFSAVAAQTVCDLMRKWAPPVETSATQVAALEKYTNALRDLIGSPSDALYGASHVRILGHAEALLLNEERYPSIDRMPASYGWIDNACTSLGLTPENSKFGFTD